ncbi:MAG: ABC transporter substrate-binding protein, partial [Comamonadaceae bacterium]|nr:ABC transporter substrate-binding protein [Comamonadaceae bacterium]
MKWKIVQRIAAALAAAATLLYGASAGAQTQGVSDGEVVLGTYLDFSGPLATWGTALRSGMEMAVDEINAAGGVHGRKLRLVVEDSGYDPKKAVLVTQKLLTRDQVFAMVGSLGTVTGAATMPLVLKRGLPHLFPVTPSEMFALPFDRLKFAYFTPYYDDVRTSVKYLLASKRFSRVGVLYQDDEFGADILKATQDQLAEAGLKPVSTTSYKRGATDFSS